MFYRFGTGFAVEIDCGVTNGSCRAVCACRTTTIRQRIRNVGGDGVSYSSKHFDGGPEVWVRGREQRRLPVVLRVELGRADYTACQYFWRS